jgi:hypothetical protein
VLRPKGHRSGVRHVRRRTPGGAHCEPRTLRTGQRGGCRTPRRTSSPRRRRSRTAGRSRAESTGRPRRGRRAPLLSCARSAILSTPRRSYARCSASPGPWRPRPALPRSRAAGERRLRLRLAARRDATSSGRQARGVPIKSAGRVAPRGATRSIAGAREPVPRQGATVTVGLVAKSSKLSVGNSRN